MQLVRCWRFATAVLVAWCLAASSAHATASLEMRCQAARYRVAGKYARCQAHAQAYREKSVNFSVYQFRASKCRDRYRAKWTRLQARFPATSCAAPRFVDNGTTVTDNLTGLEWEKKTNLDATPNGADPNDADNTYTWCADANLDFQCDDASGPGDGTAFTAFLMSLDSGGCFAGRCDWRLPTREELQTILAEPFPCSMMPCIDPVFGPTASDIYWSSTSYDQFDPTQAWYVDFGQGVVGINVKALNTFVRAVRGGLL